MKENKVRERAERIVDLMPDIIRSIGQAMRDPDSTCEEHLTPRQAMAVMAISQLGECSVNELAEKLRIAQSTASQGVDRLVKAGIVWRGEDERDRRRNIVRLSESGRSQLAQHQERLVTGYSTALSALEESDQARFEQAFRDLHEIALKIQHKMREQGGEA